MLSSVIVVIVALLCVQQSAAFSMQPMRWFTRSSSSVTSSSTSLFMAQPHAHSLLYNKFKNAILETDSFTIEELEELKSLIASNLARKEAKNVQSRESQPLHDILEITKEACEAVTPMLQAFYSKISGANPNPNGMGTDYFKDLTAKLKADATYFSIADGIVQHMFNDFLFEGNKFAAIVGEEDDTKVNIETAPYTVDELVVPEEFNNLVQNTLAKIKTLATKIDPNAYKDITVFVDPIDGTREFATGKGDSVSILVGYNDRNGKPIAGMIYRPLTSPPTWAAGAESEGCVMGHLDRPAVPNPRGILVSDGKISKFLSKLIDELGLEKVPSLASGNRALMLLEGKAGAYIRDTGGFAKWDTSGPTAVVEAYGGVMSKLPPFLSDQTLESYTHLKTPVNLDFEPGQVQLTKSNAVNKSDVPKDEVKVVSVGMTTTTYITSTTILVPDVSMVKPYSCMSGLVCVDKANTENLPAIHAAMVKVKAENAPLYT